MRRDHPRSRGVYELAAVKQEVAKGSSPLARGLPRRHLSELPRVGIIPARAGFTDSRHCGPRIGVDHPRSRGVYHAEHSPHRAATGSSPLARGLHHKLERDTEHRRIIPARAGFTSCGRPRSRRTADHPRSRGVYPFDGMVSSPCGGSSPLARGLLTMPRGRVGHGRIIPARAGFTPESHAPSGGQPDHPRSRGVYPPRVFPTHTCTGSSPLARGLPDARRARARGPGIIPARAGFTGVRPRRSLIALGSSPLARGLRPRRHHEPRRPRIIPARAGFTHLRRCAGRGN